MYAGSIPARASIFHFNIITLRSLSFYKVIQLLASRVNLIFTLFQVLFCQFFFSQGSLIMFSVEAITVSLTIQHSQSC